MESVESNKIIEVIAYSYYEKGQCEVFAVTNDKRHIPICNHFTTTDKNDIFKEFSEFLITFVHNNIEYEINGTEEQIKRIDNCLCNKQELPRGIDINHPLPLVKLI